MHYAQRFFHHAADDGIFVVRRRRERLGAEGKQRMDADDDGDRQRLAALLHLVLQRPQMAADGHEDAQLALARHHQAVVAGVTNPSVGIGRDDDAGGDVRGGVDIVVGEQRHFGQIDVVAKLDDFLHRRVGNFYGRKRFSLALGKLRGEFFRLALQRQRHQLAARLNIDHHRRIAAFDLFAVEQRKPFGSFQLG